MSPSKKELEGVFVCSVGNLPAILLELLIYKSHFSRFNAAIPSGLQPMSIARAAVEFEAAMLKWYVGHVDERIIEALKAMTSRVKSEKDYERLIRMGFALSKMKTLSWVFVSPLEAAM